MDLQSVKTYLKIEDYDGEDDDISELIEVSEIYIDECVGTTYKENPKGIKLANLVQKKLILDMYENKTTYITERSKRDIIVTTILTKLSLM